MKTISGKLVSSKPISLSRAAKNLSGFAGHENGASDAVSVYLQRAADAFNSLVSFHRELKNPHSLSKRRTSHVKIEENLDAGKVEILESREKKKKNPDFEVKIEKPLEVELKTDLVVGIEDKRDLKNERKGEKNVKETIKIAQIPDEVGEEMEENKHEETVKNEKSMDVEHATPDQVEEKRKKKKHKKEKVKNEEPVKLEQSPDKVAGEKQTKVLDESGKGTKNKQVIARIMQRAGEIEEGSAKEGEKKKRKNRDSEDGGEGVEVEQRKSRDVDGGENIDLAEQSGKKKRKRRKTEGDN